MIAGVGPYGSEAASEFVQSPQHLAELAGKLPRNWENKNLELVIETDVIGCKSASAGSSRYLYLVGCHSLFR